MPNYNQPPLDVWSNFAQGMEIGGALRRQSQQQQYGQAYEQGGWGAVADTAGGFGDLETAQGAQGVESDQQEAAIARAQRNATVLSNAATSLMGVPYEQRGQRLQQMAPMLTQMGLDEQQIAQFDPTDEALASVRAMQGQFSEFVDLREHEGALLGVRADNSTVVLREPTPQWQDVPQDQLPAGARFGQRNVRTGQADFDYSAGGGGMGGEQYQMLTPAEVEQAGLPPGSYQRNTANGQVTVVGRTRGQYTDAAGNSAQYASRMDAADATLTVLEDSFTDPTGVFLAQGGMGTESERRVRQAQREFVNAILRRESGAVISDSEFASAAQQYFPQPGDTRAVIDQKRAARRRSIQGLINASQGAYEEWYGEGSGAERPPPQPPAGSVIGSSIRLPGGAPPAGGTGLESLSEEQLDQLERELTGQ